jgi:hypothetical protein
VRFSERCSVLKTETHVVAEHGMAMRTTSHPTLLRVARDRVQ